MPGAHVPRAPAAAGLLPEFAARGGGAGDGFRRSLSSTAPVDCISSSMALAPCLLPRARSLRALSSQNAARSAGVVRHTISGTSAGQPPCPGGGLSRDACAAKGRIARLLPLPMAAPKSSAVKQEGGTDALSARKAERSSAQGSPARRPREGPPGGPAPSPMLSIPAMVAASHRAKSASEMGGSLSASGPSESLPPREVSGASL